MSPDKDDGKTKSGQHTEGMSSGRGGNIISSSGESSTGVPITPETHRPEDLKTIHYVAGATARGWIDRMRAFFGGKK